MRSFTVFDRGRFDAGRSEEEGVGVAVEHGHPHPPEGRVERGRLKNGRAIHVEHGGAEMRDDHRQVEPDVGARYRRRASRAVHRLPLDGATGHRARSETRVVFVDPVETV